MYLIAEFREKEALIVSLKALQSSGVKPDDLDIFSEEPIEFRRGILDRPSHMSVVSVGGAILLGSAATAFVYFAQHNYRLPTGGMPIFSFWASGVITFEMTMLGAVLATFSWFLWESGLIRKRDKTAPIPEVDPGAMCLRVRCRAELAAGVNEIMMRAGATRVDRTETA